ncbi:MAG: hypothetical protein EHM70_16135 [Chloroflexota bacterium]|nr:MAG: hypothetical protein EHM70_16135 [Chloroflexota bacterium]
MERRIYIYNREGEYTGYVRIGTDPIGQTVGEVYTPQADRLGAIRYEPLQFAPEQSLVYDPEGIQVGEVHLESYDNSTIGGTVYRVGPDGAVGGVVAHVLQDPDSGDDAQVRKQVENGERLGALKAENISREELVVVGGGAALLTLIPQ